MNMKHQQGFTGKALLMFFKQPLKKVFSSTAEALLVHKH
jgi:hypothetical protein